MDCGGLPNMGVHGVNCMTGGEGRDLGGGARLECNTSCCEPELGGAGHARLDGLGPAAAGVATPWDCCGFLLRFNLNLLRFNLILK